MGWDVDSFARVVVVTRVVGCNDFVLSDASLLDLVDDSSWDIVDNGLGDLINDLSWDVVDDSVGDIVINSLVDGVVDSSCNVVVNNFGSLCLSWDSNLVLDIVIDSLGTGLVLVGGSWHKSGRGVVAYLFVCWSGVAVAIVSWSGFKGGSLEAGDHKSGSECFH